MAYVVFGVTGNTGSVVVESLLARGKSVRAVVRDAKKGEALRARGAEVVVASLETGEGLADAVRGAEGVYALVPPDLASRDPLGRAARIVENLARALEGSGAKQLVFLSSIGAQHETGTGVIRTLHAAEKRLRALSIPTTFVRAAYFLENWASALHPARGQGVVPSFHDLARTIPTVATRDIGVAAANALLEPASGTRVIELAGARDLSPNDVAKLYGDALGKEVKAIHVPEAQIVPTLTGFGISPETADLFREMAVGIDRGMVDYEGKGATFVRGTTDPAAVVRAWI